MTAQEAITGMSSAQRMVTRASMTAYKFLSMISAQISRDYPQRRPRDSARKTFRVGLSEARHMRTAAVKHSRQQHALACMRKEHSAAANGKQLPRSW